MSKKYQLKKEDFKRWIRNIIVFLLPVIYLFFEQIEAWNFDLKILKGLFIWLLIDLWRRFLTDYTKNNG